MVLSTDVYFEQSANMVKIDVTYIFYVRVYCFARLNKYSKQSRLLVVLRTRLLSLDARYAHSLLKWRMGGAS